MPLAERPRINVALPLGLWNVWSLALITSNPMSLVLFLVKLTLMLVKRRALDPYPALSDVDSRICAPFDPRAGGKLRVSSLFC